MVCSICESTTFSTCRWIFVQSLAKAATEDEEGEDRNEEHGEEETRLTSHGDQIDTRVGDKEIRSCVICLPKFSLV
jgi:hypothetical protein